MSRLKALIPLGWLSLSLAIAACGALPSTPAAAAKVGAMAARDVTGNVQYLPGITSKYLKTPHDVWVWLPPGYNTVSASSKAKVQKDAQRFPVLYMHDGQNLFDPTLAFGGNEWHVDEACTQLISSGQIPPIIVVGIGNTSDRINELTWFPGTNDGQTMGGDGANYAKFMVEELKPMIDQKFRTLPDRDHTGVMGSSLGGLESFYLGANYANVFSKIGIMSPSVWWDNCAALQSVPSYPTNERIWLDIGWQEGDDPQAMLQDARNLDTAFVARGYQQGSSLDYYEDKQGGHNELAWAYRTPFALKFLWSGTPAQPQP